MKRIRNALLALLGMALLLCLFPTFAAADESGKCGDDLTWSYDYATNTLTITGSGKMDDFEPNEAPWKDYIKGITSVSLPSGLTYIGAYAFEDCTKLTSITIPNGVTGIGSHAFDSSGLTSITIPSSVTSIGYSAFTHCHLTSLTIPNSVTSIGGGAFFYCSELTSVIIPNSVTSIGDAAFEYCTGLTSVTIPNSVTSIGDSVFEYCTGLTSVTIPNSVNSIGGQAFSGCSGLTSVTIPNNVTSIGYEAFYKCTGLTSVNIPDSVTEVGKDAFLDTGWWAAQSNGLIYSGKHLLGYKGTLPKSISIASGTKIIAEYAFRDCSGITNVTIPNSVTHIGDNAFNDCSGLISVTIPSSVISFGEFAFSGCTAMTSLTIDSGLTSIGYGAFSGCSGLKSVTIPDSVTGIENYAFSNCGLTSVTIPASVKLIGEYAFAHSDLTSLTLLGSTRLGMRAFFCCTKLRSVTFPCGAGNGGGTFEGCCSIEEIHLTKGTGTMSFTFGNMLEYAYQGWNEQGEQVSMTPPALTVIVDEGVKTISCDGFGAAVTYLTLPVSVTTIENDAFPLGLQTVTYGGTEAQRNAINIYSGGNEGLENATWHYSSTGSVTGHDSSTGPVVGLNKRYNIKYGNYSAKIGPEELSIKAHRGLHNKQMAVFCAILSDASYNADLIKDVYDQMGISENNYFLDYNGSFCSSIAFDSLNISGKKTNILIIAVRGTNGNLDEIKADRSSESANVFFGNTCYTAIYNFEERIMGNVASFLTTHKDLRNGPLKIIVTGHSLGGAAANLIAARFTNFLNSGDAWWSDLLESEDIFAYTFGAIDSLVKGPVSSGFSNIHNVFNDYDTFGPDGNRLVSPAGNSMKGKFGDIDLFRKDYKDTWQRIRSYLPVLRIVEDVTEFPNHQMYNYLDAVWTETATETGLTYSRSRVKCPVDIDVYSGDDLIGQIVNETVTKTSTEVDLFVIGDAKYVVFPSEKHFQIRFLARDAGTMSYSIDNLNGGSNKQFEQVELTKGKVMTSEVGGSVSIPDVKLYVVDDEGKPVGEVQTDGTETAIVTPTATPVATPTATPTPVPTPTPEPATVKKVQAKKSVKLQAPKVKKATYQWLYRTGKFGAWQSLGKKGSKQKLSVKATMGVDGYQYRCRVTSPTRSVSFTDIYELYLYEPLKVKKQPKWGKASLPGSKMTLSVTATGASGYQWMTRPNGSAGWAAIDGATGTSYVVDVQEGMGGRQYACQISGKAGTAQSKAAVVKIAPWPKVKFSKQPVLKKPVVPGSWVTLTVKAQNADTYQWYYRTSSKGAWILYSGATQPNLTFQVGAGTNGYQYKCTAKGRGGTVESKPVTLKVVTP